MFLDANVLIHAYHSTDREGPPCARLMERIGNGEQRAVTSVLVVNEVLHFFYVKYDAQRAEQTLRRIQQVPNLEILPLDQKILDRAVGYMQQGLETSDAFHAATMKANDIKVICSYDKGFDQAEGIRRQEPK